MRAGRLLVAGVASAIATVALAGCGSADEAAGEPPASFEPPPTSGVMPWGGDWYGFGDRTEARCEDTEFAVAMAWTTQDRFTVCRNHQGVRYLRAWTDTGPGEQDRSSVRKGPLRAEFFVDTDNSAQFTTENGAKVDLGPSTVTIEWPQAPGSNQKKFTSLRLDGSWSRLD